MRYVAIINKDRDSSHGVSFPDLPGCISAGDTLDEAIANAVEALAFHIEGMVEDGDVLPKPRALDDIAGDKSLAEDIAGGSFAHIPLVRDLGSSKRVNVSFDPGLLEAIDEAAKERKQTRSAFLASAARHVLRV